jgi:hypothetical protein
MYNAEIRTMGHTVLLKGHRDPAPTQVGVYARKMDALALLLCVLAGLLISALPSFLFWIKTGSPIWIADHDEYLYLAYASQSYHNHPLSLADPQRAGAGGSIYPWFQFAPGILAAKLLNLSPIFIGMLWRIWAGISVGAAWYLLIRVLIGKTIPALCIALIMLGDIGNLTGQPLLRQFVVPVKMLLGHANDIFATVPQIHTEWRLMTPALSLAYLLLHILLTSRARRRPTWGRIVWSGIGFGLLFPVYFYYWTTATAALVLASIFDKGSRRVYLHTLWIGVVAGLPSLIAAYRIKREYPPDWLLRTDFSVPIGHFSELLIPKLAYLLAAALGFWAYYRRRDLLHLWSLAAAGLLLLNQQVLTGLQMQNFHFMYAFGTCLSLLVILSIWDGATAMATPRQCIAGLAAICAIHMVTAISLRAMEAVKTKETLTYTADTRRYLEQAAKIRFLPNSVLAGSRDFLDPAEATENLRPLEHYCTIFSPSITDAELDRRVALNRYLEGMDRVRFEADQRDALSEVFWNAKPRNVERRKEQLVRRLAAYDVVAAEPEKAVREFEVRYVAIKADRFPASYLSRAGTLLQKGPFWQVWEFSK